MTNIEKYEYEIRMKLSHTKLDHALLFLKSAVGELEPFVAAGMTLACLRFCRHASDGGPSKTPMDGRLFMEAKRLVIGYLLSDPLDFDEELRATYDNGGANPLFPLLRIFANQICFAPEEVAQFARARILFSECPDAIASLKSTPSFDFRSNFLSTNGSDVGDFIRMCYMAYVGHSSKKHLGVTPSYYVRATEEGIALPEGKVMRRVLEAISAHPQKFNTLYTREKRRDRTYAAYDYNPILRYPLIRPWRTGRLGERMIAPLPNLIAHRACFGIYSQMRADFTGKFTNYFGHLFEHYVGIVLKHSANAESRLFSESDIRRSYGMNEGKCPDWVVIEGEAAIMFECKATSFRPDAIATGLEDAINQSLRQVEKALVQMDEFVGACKSKHPGLSAFSNCKKFYPVVMTFETMQLIDTPQFRDHIKGLLDGKLKEDLPWRVIDVGKIERYQPHAAQGHKFSFLFDSSSKRSLQDRLSIVEQQTGLDYKDGFLYKSEVKVLQSMGVTEKMLTDGR